MSSEREYLTIKEVSKAAGVSVQSIYQRLETSLKDYVKIVKGKKYLDISVLRDIYGVEVEKALKDIKQGFKQDIKDDSKGDKSDDTVKLLQDTLDTLRQQLEQKDKQIKELHNLLDQEQQLNAINSKKILELEQKQEEQKTITEPEQPKETLKWWQRLFK